MHFLLITKRRKFSFPSCSLPPLAGRKLHISQFDSLLLLTTFTIRTLVYFQLQNQPSKTKGRNEHRKLGKELTKVVWTLADNCCMYDRDRSSPVAEIGEVVEVLGEVIAFACETWAGSRRNACHGSAVHAPRLERALGELHGGRWEFGSGPPVGWAVEGVAPGEHVVAPVGGIGEAPVGVLRPLLLHRLHKVWNQALHWFFFLLSSSFFLFFLKQNLIGCLRLDNEYCVIVVDCCWRCWIGLYIYTTGGDVHSGLWMSQLVKRSYHLNTQG